MTGENLVASADPQPYLSLSVFTRRDRLDLVLLQFARDRHRRVDGLKERVDRPVAHTISADLSPLATDNHAPGRRSGGTNARVPADELQWVVGHFELIADERNQVGGG